jgi:membrane-associated phospholipid phosphatase
MSLPTALLVSAALTSALPPAAVAQLVEQPHRYSHQFISGQEAAISGLVLFATAFGDEGLQEEVQDIRSSGTNSLAHVGNTIGSPFFVFPAIGVGYLAGRLTHSPSLTRLSVRAGTTVVVASGITTALKYSIGRTRPFHGGDSDQFHPFSGSTSFPSGHTTLAFALATVIADETKDSWSDVALYSAAALTGFARMNDDRHWASDVLAGALIGHLTARWVDRRGGLLNVGPRSVGLSLEF